jgi:hypothetical protein
MGQNRDRAEVEILEHGRAKASSAEDLQKGGGLTAAVCKIQTDHPTLRGAIS